MRMITPNIEIIDPKTFKGMIPPGKDLVVLEEGQLNTAMTLYGFDEMTKEVATSLGIKKPQFGFM
mgnify:CR=1 FL=1